jgi:aspartate 1-decarboxylase
MEIQVMKSKLHGVTVTQAELDYIGSITIDEDLMDAAHLIENEQVHILNKNNGERLITYVIRGPRGSGVICLNGPAALKVNVGDVVIVVSYATMEFEKAKNWTPWVVFPESVSNLVK